MHGAGGRFSCQALWLGLALVICEVCQEAEAKSGSKCLICEAGTQILGTLEEGFTNRRATSLAQDLVVARQLKALKAKSLPARPPLPRHRAGHIAARDLRLVGNQAEAR